jgi:DNA invertase Pin-like site-specific DNA recombinase
LRQWRWACPETGKVRRHAMKVGYARVSKKDQNLDLQLRPLKAEGCDRIFREKMSGKRWDRPELDAALRSLKKGDVLVVWHLDRLGRSARELVNLNYEFKCQGILSSR